MCRDLSTGRAEQRQRAPGDDCCNGNFSGKIDSMDGYSYIEQYAEDGATMIIRASATWLNH